MWRALGFRSIDGLKRVLGRGHEPMPLLIRPAAQTPTPADWNVAGRDLADIDSWQLLEICSDGA